MKGWVEICRGMADPEAADVDNKLKECEKEYKRDCFPVLSRATTKSKENTCRPSVSGMIR